MSYLFAPGAVVLDPEGNIGEVLAPHPDDPEVVAVDFAGSVLDMHVDDLKHRTLTTYTVDFRVYDQRYKIVEEGEIDASIPMEDGAEARSHVQHAVRDQLIDQKLYRPNSHPALSQGIRRID